MPEPLELRGWVRTWARAEGHRRPRLVVEVKDGIARCVDDAKRTHWVRVAELRPARGKR